MYIPIIKTGEAEIRALTKLSPLMLDGIIPIIELTRGRQKTKTIGRDKIVTFPFDQKFIKAKLALAGKTVFLDLTTDVNLLSNEIYELYNPENGYHRWVDFVQGNIGDNSFNKIIPSILFNWDDENFENNFKKQVETLGNAYGEIMYRSPIQTNDCYDELPLLLRYLPNKCKIWIILDVGYLHDSAVEWANNKCRARINNMMNSFLEGRNAHFVVAATSYPERVYDYSEENPIIITHSEVNLFEKLREIYPDLIYGDYAGICPIRKDLIVMSRGWIPKIDLSLERETRVYWKRRPKGTTEYKGTYRSVAESVIKDKDFPLDLEAEWGVREIIDCANGIVPSSAPSYWISVRMYNHIFHQLMRLDGIR